MSIAERAIGADRRAAVSGRPSAWRRRGAGPVESARVPRNHLGPGRGSLRSRRLGFACRLHRGVEYYGGTEGFAGSTIGPEEWLAHPGSVGKPLNPVHVLSENGIERPVGECGELFFEGGPTFEYFKDPEKTASDSNVHGWRSLGDMG